MTASFPNHRYDALPCERMAGCVLADDFLSQYRSEELIGFYSSSGDYTISRGFVNNEEDSVSGWGNLAQLGKQFSAVVKFKTTNTTQDYCYLLGNTTPLFLENGFIIWAEAGKIYARHDNGSAASSSCEVTIDYADGEEHTVTYVVDMIAHTHTLYVDSLAKNEKSTAIDAELGNVVQTAFTLFAGTLYKVRVMTSVLTETDHGHYRDDTLTDFWSGALAAYRCDGISNDTEGDHILDSTENHNDILNHGAELVTDRYLLLPAKSYIDGWPDLETPFTISYVLSIPDEIYPVVYQDNDGDFLTEIANGEVYGYLHSMRAYEVELTDLQKCHDSYMQMYWRKLGRAQGAYTRLIHEGVTALSVFMDAEFAFLDRTSDINGNAHDVTTAGRGGCSFPSADSNVTYENNAELSMKNGAISVFCSLRKEEAEYSGVIVDKGTNYKLSYSMVLVGE